MVSLSKLNSIVTMTISVVLLTVSGCGNEIRPTDTSAINYGFKLTKPVGERSLILFDYQQADGSDNETLGSGRSVSFGDNSVYGGSTLAHDFSIMRAALKYQFAVSKSKNTSFNVSPFISWLGVDLKTKHSSDVLFNRTIEEKSVGADFSLIHSLHERLKFNTYLGFDVLGETSFREAGVQFEFALESKLGFYTGLYRWDIQPETRTRDPGIQMTASGAKLGIKYDF